MIPRSCAEKPRTQPSIFIRHKGSSSDQRDEFIEIVYLGEGSERCCDSIFHFKRTSIFIRLDVGSGFGKYKIMNYNSHYLYYLNDILILFLK